MRARALDPPPPQRQPHAPISHDLNPCPSPFLARAGPWPAVMLGSRGAHMAPLGSAPVLPPLGFMFLLSWRQLRPGLLPVWAGLPLGLFDDLYSGQPFGSAMLTWSLAMIVLDVIEARFPWRSFLFDWAEAAGLVAAYLLLGLAFANAAGAATPVRVLVPQLAISLLLYPLAGRIVSLFDRFRLLPFREVA